MKHIYKLKYDLKTEAGEFDGEAIKAKGQGATDALLLASFIYPADGSFSLAFLSKDGRTGGELADKEIFKMWLMLAKRLSQSKTLDEGKRLFVGDIFQFYAELMQKAKTETT